jgi:hypothetical protein
MPCQFQIDRHRNLVRETWTGVVTVDDLKRLSEQEWTHPDYIDGVDILSDFRAAQVEIDFERMTAYTAWLEQADTINRQAIVVSRATEYGLARMFATLTEETQIWKNCEIFLDLSAALKWLSSDDPPTGASFLHAAQRLTRDPE